MKRAALLPAALLAGCAMTAGDPADPTVPAPGLCDAAKVQRFTGRRADVALVEAARKASGAAVARTLVPGTMVTMEYRADRLNVTVDDKGLATAVRCG